MRIVSKLTEAYVCLYVYISHAQTHTQAQLLQALKVLSLYF